MIKKHKVKAEQAFEWVDLTAPSHEELAEVAETYNLHPALVNDCLQPDHLPKYEAMDDYDFIIFRVYTAADVADADTVQELTGKIAIFYSERFMVTIHRKPHQVLDSLADTVQAGKCAGCRDLLNLLIKACLNTYEPAYNKLARDLDYYEQMVFLKQRNVPLLKGMYYLRRKADLLKRMLILSYEIIDHVDPEEGSVHTRDTRDIYIRLQNLFDAAADNVNQLLNIYFSVSSQRTNEIMRILTIFSVFFMPLTFVVGIYGMNFEFMPELTWKFGYPAVMILMAIITICIYFWFRRKKWL